MIETISSLPPPIQQFFNTFLLEKPLGSPDIYIKDMDKWFEKAKKRYSGKKIKQCEIIFNTFMEFYEWAKKFQENKKKGDSQAIPSPNFNDAKYLTRCPKILREMEYFSKTVSECQ